MRRDECTNFGVKFPPLFLQCSASFRTSLQHEITSVKMFPVLHKGTLIINIILIIY